MINLISLDAVGNCYPCNRLYNIKSFYLGNLVKLSANEIIEQSIKLSANRWDSLKKGDCINCDIHNFCYGGCPAIAYSVYKNYDSKGYFCEAFKKIRQHIKSIVL